MFLQKMLLDWSSPLDMGRNEVVFEHRNKAYGAYQLRRDYDMVLFYSLLGATALFVSLICSQLLFHKTIVTKNTFESGSIIMEKLITIPKEDPILEPIKKIDIPKAAEAVKPPVLVKGLNFNNLELDQHSRVNSNVEIVPDANAKPDATPITNNQTPPPTLPDNGNQGGQGNGTANNNAITDAPDKLPAPVGGMEALMKYINKNISYPRISVENGEESKVFVRFVVEKDGSVTIAEVTRGGQYAALNKEALRVIKNMPAWIPGMSGGAPARVYFTIPINFVLSDN